MARAKFAPPLLAGLICILAGTALRAQTVEEFYKGRTLSLVIPNAPGGSFDLYARLLADNLGASSRAIPRSCRRTCPARPECRRRTISRASRRATAA